MLTVMMTSYSTSIAQNWLCLRIFEVGVSCCRGHPLDHTDVKENSAMMLRITKRLKTYKEQTCWQHFSVLHSVCSNWKAASDVPSPSPASGCVVKMTMAKQHIPNSQKHKKHDDDDDVNDSCSSQPSMVLWLSSPILLVRLFVCFFAMRTPDQTSTSMYTGIKALC